MRTKTTTKRFERITDLALTLRGAHQPLTLAQLVQQIPGYPVEGDEQSLRTAFERDKRTLRAHGLNIVTDGPEASIVATYAATTFIDDTIDFNLTHLERASLWAAMRTVRMNTTTSRDAMAKLAVGEPMDLLPDNASIAILNAAIAAHWPVRFSHRRRVCDVDPYAIVEDGTDWYLIGRDRHFEGQQLQRFRIALIEEGPLVDIDETFKLPPQADPTHPHFEEASGGGFEDDCWCSATGRALDAGDQYARLMAILSILERCNANGTCCALSTLAVSFQLPIAALVEELELAACFGIAPYTPDRLLDIVVDQDHDIVLTSGLEQFARPTALTIDEATHVARAATALLHVTDLRHRGILEHALAKLSEHVLLEDSEVETTTMWPTLVHLSVPEVTETIGRVMVGAPKVQHGGGIAVVAFLADRRWTRSLLTGHTDYISDVTVDELEYAHYVDRRQAC